MPTKYLEVRPRSISLSGARLLVTRGNDRGRALRITKQVVTVGSGPACDLVLGDDSVSRQHLTLRVRPDAYVVSDLESTNGTYLDGHRIFSAELRPGDTLELGQTRLRLEDLADSTDLPLSEATSFGKLVGCSAESRRLFAQLAAVASADATVLLSGETGTGKDLAAQAIHDASPRAARPFVVIDCSVLPAASPDSELLAPARETLAEALDHAGTVFFDEVGRLPHELQPYLLRCLEQRDGKRTGEGRSAEARIIAATDRDLRLAVNRGSFREDLFYRLNVVNIELPPLRERPDDIPVLATHFYRELTGDPAARLPAARLEALMRHDWPGNVRELRNAIEETVALADVAPPGGKPGPLPSYKQAKAKASAEFERRYLLPLLEAAGGNVSEAARMAKMDRVNLIKLLRKHNITPRGQRGLETPAADSEADTDAA